MATPEHNLKVGIGFDMRAASCIHCLYMFLVQAYVPYRQPTYRRGKLGQDASAYSRETDDALRAAQVNFLLLALRSPWVLHGQFRGSHMSRLVKEGFQQA